MLDDEHSGYKRKEEVVEEHVADLLRGALKDWQGPKTLVLALDASALSTRFEVLSISVVTRGCGIRVAWTILPGHQLGEWRPHWERMVKQLAEAVPSEWSVLVMADRGLDAPWFFAAICANGLASVAASPKRNDVSNGGGATLCAD